MNILKKFRNSKLIGFSAICFLIFSCSQYELNQERAFDFAIYEAYKDNPLSQSTIDLIKASFKKSTSKSSLRNQIIEIVNLQYNANLDIDNPIWDTADKSVEEMKSYYLENQILSESDIEMFEELTTDIETIGFEDALLSFEEKVIASNPDQETFDKFNSVVNTLKIVDEVKYNNASSKNNYSKSINVAQRSPLGCLVAFVLWVGAVASLVACVTVILCGFAAAAAIAATAELVLECVPDTPDGDLGDGPGNPMW